MRIVWMVALMLVIGGQSAGAAMLGPADGFNAFIFENLTAQGGDTEGRLAVGGDFVAQSYSVNHGGGVGAPVSNSFGTIDALVVGGDLNAIGGWQVFNGNAVHGGSVISSPTIQAGSGTIRQDQVIDFAAAKTQLTALSQNLATLDNSAGASSVYQWGGLTLTGTDSDLVVFNVDGALMQSAHTININTPVGATVLINVAGHNVSLTSKGVFVNGVNGSANPNLLFNFHQADDLNVQSIAIPGSVLAPTAALFMASGGINGVTIVNSATTSWGGEFHNFTFTGNLPPMSDNSTIPEPTTAALGIFLTAGYLLRRPHGRV